jgi:hypothetical protein
MSKPFEAMGERLLREGVAPRHVRAYLTELREHLADIIEQECAAGGDAREALARAHARLGDDETLAQAMLSRRRVRSLTARAPWLVLGVTPVLLMFVALLLGLTVLIIVTSPVMAFLPGWLKFIAFATVNLLLTPALPALFAFLAWRQRLSPLWPLAGSVAILLLLLLGKLTYGFPGAPQGFHNAPTLMWPQWSENRISVGVGLLPFFPLPVLAKMAAQWALIGAQLLLTLLPSAWLWRAYRRNAA